MYYRLFLAFALILRSFCGYSQFGWEAWETIYTDAYVTVEVQFSVSDNSCEIDGKKFKFRTRIKGEYRTTPYFVNWKMDYTDCNGLFYYQQNSIPIWRSSGGISDEFPIESIDDKFNAKSLDKLHYEIEGSPTKHTGSGIRTNVESKDPSGIIGKNVVVKDETVLLTVSGGFLGDGATWVWYKGQCGSKKIGKGPSLNIQIDATTTVFVRAEGKYGTTKCAQLTIVVDQNSRAPTSITLKSPSCVGMVNTLIVNDGHLGVGAKWNWYENSCHGKFIGTGSTIDVITNKKTTYFVKAEGGSITTTCAQLVVEPSVPTPDPTQITAQSTKICEGESIELSILDKNLAKDALWIWYGGGCDGYPLDTGSVIKITPQQTTTYYLRGVGKCNSTKCVSTSIEVTKPIEIISSQNGNTINQGDMVVLKLSDDYLKTNTVALWYEGNCGKGQSIGKGAKITIYPEEKTTYYVKASNQCNEKDCQSITIEPEKLVKTHQRSKNSNSNPGMKKVLQGLYTIFALILYILLLS